MMFYAPLLQFELIEKAPSCDFDYFFPFLGFSEFDNAGLWLLSIVGLWQIFQFYSSEILNLSSLHFKHEALLQDLITKVNFQYSSLFLTIFFIIFSSNFSGLIPYTQTITSQLLLTLVIAFISMFVIWLHAWTSNKILMFNHFLPSGAPLLLTPFIILIELISNSSRIISLSVRLFANMTSGHALLKILAGFGLSSLLLTAVWKGIVVFPILIIFIITILEIIIAFLQTYVFITLLLIYINEQE